MAGLDPGRQEVSDFLTRSGLGKFVAPFFDFGVSNLNDLLEEGVITDKDLEERIGMLKAHRKKYWKVITAAKNVLTGGGSGSNEGHVLFTARSVPRMESPSRTRDRRIHPNRFSMGDVDDVVHLHDDFSVEGGDYSAGSIIESMPLSEYLMNLGLSAYLNTLHECGIRNVTELLDSNVTEQYLEEVVGMTPDDASIVAKQQVEVKELQYQTNTDDDGDGDDEDLFNFRLSVQSPHSHDGNDNNAFDIGVEDLPTIYYNGAVVPKEFICPLTKQMMTDPVLAMDGGSYERQAIQAWLLCENVSPLRQAITLNDKTVIANAGLKAEIESFRLAHPSLTSHDGDRLQQRPSSLSMPIHDDEDSKGFEFARRSTTSPLPAEVDEDMISKNGSKVLNSTNVKTSKPSDLISVPSMSLSEVYNEDDRDDYMPLQRHCHESHPPIGEYEDEEATDHLRGFHDSRMAAVPSPRPSLRV